MVYRKRFGGLLSAAMVGTKIARKMAGKRKRRSNTKVSRQVRMKQAKSKSFTGTKTKGKEQVVRAPASGLSHSYTRLKYNVTPIGRIYDKLFKTSICVKQDEWPLDKFITSSCKAKYCATPGPINALARSNSPTAQLPPVKILMSRL